MILDSIENIACYRRDPVLYSILEKMAGITELPVDPIVLDGKNAFINPNRYTSKRAEEGAFEGHHRYADVQFILKGAERISVLSAADAEETVPYSVEKDIAFFRPVSDRITDLVLYPGEFVVLYPPELHRPGIAPDDVPAPVEKLVGKMLLQAETGEAV